VLPLGISFFTFTQIAYLVDAYRGETKEYNFLNYCLFVVFFPHLIAGPILHHKDIIPQFERKSIFRFSWSHFAVGLTIFAIGLYKKVVLADGVAFYSTFAFEAASEGEELSFYKACGDGT
jgi:D-alanyl-lipoteichoic acid acyltransferase DltB (MBOAT superfamily)